MVGQSIWDDFIRYRVETLVTGFLVLLLGIMHITVGRFGIRMIFSESLISYIKGAILLTIGFYLLEIARWRIWV